LFQLLKAILLSEHNRFATKQKHVVLENKRQNENLSKAVVSPGGDVA
jgi:hypothetical protein